MRTKLFAGCAVAILFVAICANAGAQSEPASIPHWASVVHRLALKVHDTGPASSSTGVFPPVIGQTLQNPDTTGVVETYNLNAPTDTSANPFFQSLGSNGRACAELP